MPDAKSAGKPPKRVYERAKCSYGCGKPYTTTFFYSKGHNECWKKLRFEEATGTTPPVTEQQVREGVRLVQAERDIIKLRQAQTLKAIIGDRLVEAIETIPSIKPPPYRPKKYDSGLDEEEFWADVSDCQIGSKGDAISTGGLATYSYEKFVERLDRWKNAILAISKYHPNRVRVLNLAFLGDIIEGSTIYESQLRQIEPGGAAKQVIWGVDRFCEAINELSEHFETINCYGVVGNHGRIGLKGMSWISDNLEYVLYHWMADRLKPNKRIHWDIPESYWMVVERMGYRHLLVHGDRGIRGWGGFPWYGAKRFKDSVHSLLRRTFAVADPFEYVHFGHFSQLVYFDDIWANGSFDAGTELSVTEMLSGGVAYQWLMALHPHYGISWSRKLFLTDPKDKPPMPVFRGASSLANVKTKLLRPSA